MYNVNGMNAKLIQYNRNDSESIYDDQDKQEIDIVVCPYNVDVREGDQLIFMNDTFTILEVKDNWIWNKLANISIAVK